jgi:hypothetical protein
MDVFGERLGASGLDRRQSVGEHGRQNLDHLPVAVVGADEPAPDAFQRRRQHPVLERRAVAQRARFARRDRHIGPGIVDRVAASEGPPVLGDDPPSWRTTMRSA